MAKKFDVVAVVGKYTDRNGQEKSRYMNCGAVFETEKGLSLKLEAIPVGSEGWFQLYEPRPRDGQDAQQSRQPAQAFDDPNDPPF